MNTMRNVALVTVAAIFGGIGWHEYSTAQQRDHALQALHEAHQAAHYGRAIYHAVRYFDIRPWLPSAEDEAVALGLYESALTRWVARNADSDDADPLELIAQYKRVELRIKE